MLVTRNRQGVKQKKDHPEEWPKLIACRGYTALLLFFILMRFSTSKTTHKSNVRGAPQFSIKHTKFASHLRFV
jgi:hypothetical protein